LKLFTTFYYLKKENIAFDSTPSGNTVLKKFENAKK
jgi:hypothetical protein